MAGIEIFRPLRDLRTVLHQGMIGQSAAAGHPPLLDQAQVRRPRAERAAGAGSRIGAAGDRIRGVALRLSRAARARRARSAELRSAWRRASAWASSARAARASPSIVRLLLRFSDPTTGRVRSAGTTCASSRCGTPAADRGRRQDTYLFYGTIEDNLRLGRPDASQRRARGGRAHRERARVHHGAARRLPDGHRRARHAALGRPAPAPRDRARGAARRADPDPRRGALLGRRGERGRDPGGARPADGRAHDADPRPSPLERDRRRPHPRARRRPRRRERPPRRADGARRPVPAAHGGPGRGSGATASIGDAATPGAPWSPATRPRRATRRARRPRSPRAILARGGPAAGAAGGPHPDGDGVGYHGQLVVTFALGVGARRGVHRRRRAGRARRPRGERAASRPARCSWRCSSSRRSRGCCTGSSPGSRTTWRIACSPRCASISSASSRRSRRPIWRAAHRAISRRSRRRTSSRSSTSSPTPSRRRFVAVLVPARGARDARRLRRGRSRWRCCRSSPTRRCARCSAARRIDRLGSRAARGVRRAERARRRIRYRGSARSSRSSAKRARREELAARAALRGARACRSSRISRARRRSEVATGLGGLAIAASAHGSWPRGGSSGDDAAAAHPALDLGVPAGVGDRAGRPPARRHDRVDRGGCTSSTREPVRIADGPGVTGPRREAAAAIAARQRHASPTRDGSRPALPDVSFTVPAGSTVALVGPSGAGKTTIANLLLRFWDPDAGAVTARRPRPARAHARRAAPRASRSSRRTRYLFNDTLGEHPPRAAGAPRPRRWPPRSSARRCCRFVRSLPEGLDTRVGERGVQLSGGQRQRVAIARAFLKDAPILILDEATSHLDTLSEAGGAGGPRRPDRSIAPRS